MGVQGNHLHVLELVGGELLDVLVKRARAGLGRGRHEGQFEHLGLVEASRCVAEYGPGQIDDAVLRLIKQLHR